MNSNYIILNEQISLLEITFTADPDTVNKYTSDSGSTSQVKTDQTPYPHVVTMPNQVGGKPAYGVIWSDKPTTPQEQAIFNSPEFTHKITVNGVTRNMTPDEISNQTKHDREREAHDRNLFSSSSSNNQPQADSSNHSTGLLHSIAAHPVASVAIAAAITAALALAIKYGWPPAKKLLVNKLQRMGIMKPQVDNAVMQAQQKYQQKAGFPS